MLIPISKQSLTGIGERSCSEAEGRARRRRRDSGSVMKDGLEGPLGLFDGARRTMGM